MLSALSTFKWRSDCGVPKRRETHRTHVTSHWCETKNEYATLKSFFSIYYSSVWNASEEFPSSDCEIHICLICPKLVFHLYIAIRRRRRPDKFHAPVHTPTHSNRIILLRPRHIIACIGMFGCASNCHAIWIKEDINMRHGKYIRSPNGVILSRSTFSKMLFIFFCHSRWLKCWLLWCYFLEFAGFRCNCTTFCMSRGPISTNTNI